MLAVFFFFRIARPSHDSTANRTPARLTEDPVALLAPQVPDTARPHTPVWADPPVVSVVVVAVAVVVDVKSMCRTYVVPSKFMVTKWLT